MTAVSAAPPQPPRRSRLIARDTRTAWLYLIPAFVVMGIITFWPLVFQTYMSFTDFALRNLRPGAEAPPLVGLENYVRIIQDNLNIPNFAFFRIVAFNLWWALANVVLHVIIGVAIAVLLNTEGLRFKKVYRAIFILPVIIPPIIVATVWKNMFDPNAGAIGLGIRAMGGLIGLDPSVAATNWLTTNFEPLPLMPLAFFALLMANTWLGWPLNAVVATGALQSIPKELYEAAEMDGANGWQKFRNVTVTYLRPAMLPYAIYGFVVTFNLFHLSYFMSGGGPFGKTELLVTQAYWLVNEQRLYGVGAAFAVIMFFILLAITVVTTRLSRATAASDL